MDWDANPLLKRLYIAVHDAFDDHMVPTLVAHAMLAAHLKFEADPEYQQWLQGSFRKCVVRVNEKEFQKIAALPRVHLGNENKTRGALPSAIVVCPRAGELPNVLKFAKLWAPRPVP